MSIQMNLSDEVFYCVYTAVAAMVRQLTEYVNEDKEEYEGRLEDMLEAFQVLEEFKAELEGSGKNARKI